MKRLQLFSMSGFIALFLVTASFASAEMPKVQKQPSEMIQKTLKPLSNLRCSVNHIIYSPASGIKLLTYGKLILKYTCEGTGTVGPIEIEVQDGAGKVHAAKRDILLESGTYEYSMDIWQWQDYVYSNKIVTSIKFKGKEVYKRADEILCSEWFVGNPKVLLNEPIE